jgi:hypothetical protein
VARNDLIETRTSRLVDGFGHYVQAYDGRVPFTGEQLAAHRQTVALRHTAGSVRAAVTDDQFVASLLRTLREWGIGRRASRLVSDDAFAAALRTAIPQLEPLENLRIDDPTLPGDLTDRLSVIIGHLGVVENKAKLVAGTKTLHHLLPDLVPPMCRPASPNGNPSDVHTARGLTVARSSITTRQRTRACPHKGKIGDQEAAFVRTNLELVNSRRAEAGHDLIEPANPVHAKRYGFPAPEQPSA